MSQWTSPGRIVTGLVSVALLVALGASMTGAQRAQSLGLTQHGQTLTAQDAGAADAVALVAVAPGTPGQVYTISDAGLPHWAAAGGGSTATTLHADDCVAEAGNESASITGTGAAATLTVTASATTRNYGSGGATAARVVCPLSANARRIEVELGPVTALSGFSGARFLAIALRNAASGGAPANLWGVSLVEVGSGSPKGYIGDLMSGANAGATTFNQSASTGFIAVDKWVRASFDPWWPLFGLAAGTGVSSARPTSWAPIATTGLPGPFGVSIADPSSATALVVYLQSFGGGSATSVTTGLTIRVTQ